MEFSCFRDEEPYFLSRCQFLLSACNENCMTSVFSEKELKIVHSLTNVESGSKDRDVTEDRYLNLIGI